MSITHLFTDLGGVLLTNGWDRGLRKLVASQFDIDAAEVGKCQVRTSAGTSGLSSRGPLTNSTGSPRSNRALRRRAMTGPSHRGSKPSRASRSRAVSAAAATASWATALPRSNVSCAASFA